MIVVYRASMRRTVIVGLGLTALVVPNVEAYAAVKTPKPKKKVVTVTKSFTGTSASAVQWGEVEVTIVVRKTTTTVLATKKSTVTRRITKVTVPIYPDHTSRSIYLNQHALPVLIEETLQAQSSKIDMVSEASATSDAFVSSLQSALVAARRA